MNGQLITPEEAAKMLSMSTKTLTEHVKAGEISFIAIGTGKKRPRRAFSAEDIQEFIARRRDRQCPSTNQGKAPTINTTSSSTVIALYGLYQGHNEESRRDRRA